jgi:hypothetical protein
MAIVYNDLLTGEIKAAEIEGLNSHEDFILANYRPAEKQGENCGFCKYHYSCFYCKKTGTGSAKTEATKINLKYICDFFKSIFDKNGQR